jgi:hypothetical protein
MSSFVAKITPPGALAAVLLGFAACGKAPEPEAPTTAEAPAASPAQSPGKPSLVVQPPTRTKTVFVLTAFQAVTSDGTQDVAVGEEVTVLEEQGDEYVIAYRDLSVRTPKAFFSDSPVAPPSAAPVTEPTPALAEATPEPTAPPEPTATPDPTTQPLEAAAEPAPPEPSSTPDPALTADTAKTDALIGEIRSLNDQIRIATDQMETAAAPDKAAEAARIEKLKKRRDQLSADLTRVAKP